MKQLYDYLDYQLFLKEFIESEKEKKSFFSYRYIGDKLGIDASNIAKSVQGKRHLSKKGVEGFINLCKFNKRETRYFRTLIELAKAKCEEDREEIIMKLAKIRHVIPHKVEQPQYEYYTKWYHSAILALIYFFDFSDDFKLLSTKLDPMITAEEAERSIQLLKELELIKQDKNGIYRHTQNLITTGEQWRSQAISTFQAETLKMALRSLDYHTPVERDISTLTVTASRDDIKKIKEVTSRYRKEVLRIIEESETSEAVYQLNIQLFPLTKVIRQ